MITPLILLVSGIVFLVLGSAAPYLISRFILPYQPPQFVVIPLGLWGIGIICFILAFIMWLL